MEALALFGGLSFSVLLLGGVLLMYLVLIFFVGVMLFFFTGKDRTGGELLSVLMRQGGRLYAHIWMLLSSLIALLGFSLFLKAIMGALFGGFVYASSRFGYGPSVDSLRQADLQAGLILVVLGTIIFVAHWLFAYLIETKQEKKGTIITKVTITAGLFATSFVLFGMLIAFAFDLVTGAGPAGANLAWFLGAFPFWLFYALRTVWIVRTE